jgi:hypothetical protein
MDQRDEDLFFDHDQPPYLWQIVLYVILFIAVVVTAANYFMSEAHAATNPNPPPVQQEDPNEVRIAVMCGNLKGSGKVVIVDPIERKIYEFPFTCPTASI